MQTTNNASKQKPNRKNRIVRKILISFTIVAGLISISVVAWSIYSHLASKPVELTRERQLEDFEYLVQILSENYPYFSMHKRTEGLDWETVVAEARAKITDGKVDVITVSTELLNLLNDHTGFIKIHNYSTYLNAYSSSFDSRFFYDKPWADVLESPRALGNYGKVNRKIKERIGNPFAFLQDITPRNLSTQKARAQSPMVETAIIEQGKIAYLFFPGFTNLSVDREPTLEFLVSVKDYEWIIIDIRGNGGGNSQYVSRLIVPALISKPLEVPAYAFVRPGNYIKSFLKARGLGIKPLLKLPDLPQLIPEAKTDYIGFIDLSSTIKPSDKPIGFKGNIVLLVDSKVYSSSEYMAFVCKSTGFASIIGETTGGDGVGIDPALVVLPNSGYVFRFPLEAGLNPDGSLNEETNTEPDVALAPGEDALQKALELIASGWKGRDFER